MEEHCHKTWGDAAGQRIYQVGCAILIDGERRAESWLEVGPFDEPGEVMVQACEHSRILVDRQIEGQARLWQDGPVL